MARPAPAGTSAHHRDHDADGSHLHLSRAPVESGDRALATRADGRGRLLGGL